MRAAINCAICGKLFVAKNGNAKYCSKKCSDAGAMENYYKKKASKEQAAKKQRKKPLSITEIAVAARKAGMSYGQYVAKMGL